MLFCCLQVVTKISAVRQLLNISKCLLSAEHSLVTRLRPYLYSYLTVILLLSLGVTHQMHDLPPVFQTPPADWCFLLWVPRPSKWAGRSPTVRKTSWATVFSTSCSMEVNEPCEEHSPHLLIFWNKELRSWHIKVKNSVEQVCDRNITGGFEFMETHDTKHQCILSMHLLWWKVIQIKHFTACYTFTDI